MTRQENDALNAENRKKHARINRNPDVLNCLANLSNDEVFTPPGVVEKMLDLLPQEIFADPNATFLDPVCKSGVFLRQIAKRLLVGLKEKIPDDRERLEHILKRQLYGIAITELTSLLARRTLYCSKYANSPYSIVKFPTVDGNIRFKRTEHQWEKGKCKFCGAAQAAYGEEKRGENKENHAYEWIHCDKDEDIFGMKFDVIVGNPPYQMADGGASASASPLYDKFVEQAMKFNPKYISMIMPARWYSGGKGLDDFRNKMLNDRQIRVLVDYFDSTECFPGVDISGGVCYFLWEKGYKGDCKITSCFNKKESTVVRPLLEENTEVFIRFNPAVKIIRKIRAEKESSFADSVSSRKPFGFPTNPKELTSTFSNDSVKIYAYPQNGYVPRASITKNPEWVGKYKVCEAKSYGERGKFPYLVLGKPFIVEPDACCSETYIVLRTFNSEKEAQNVISYICTKFFRFLVLLQKNTQDSPKRVYELVPEQDFTRPWSDAELYAKYGLTPEEIAFIESMIRPMEL